MIFAPWLVSQPHGSEMSGGSLLIPAARPDLPAAGPAPLEDWWTGGAALILVVQGLDDTAGPHGNGHALRATVGDRAQVVDIRQVGHFLHLEQPEPVFQAVLKFIMPNQRKSAASMQAFVWFQ
jgi:pimeloyl-ACP methyl ester carboxylesterase